MGPSFSEEARAVRSPEPAHDASSGDHPERALQPHEVVLLASQSAGNQAVSRWLAGQREAMAVPRLARFGSREHQQIGADASGGASTDIDLGNGEMLPYGDMVALAGDFFGSLQEMRDLARTPAGQEELRGARWKALGIGTPPSPDVLRRVNDRYFRLAGANISHFSQGGDARASYRAGHTDALRMAFIAGASSDDRKFTEARTAEAFCDHFLTDMFAGGHVRTQRREIKEWYQQAYPDSLDRLLNYASERIAIILDNRGQTNGIPNSSIAAKLKTKIRDLGGPAVENFSLGDIISLAYHHQDNKGLNVVSDVNEQGERVAGGFQWRAEGDDRLIPGEGQQPTSDAQQTRRMVTAATRTSLAELDTARERGQQAGSIPADQLTARAEAAVQALAPFRAEAFIPREDTAAGNVQMNWYWGSLDPVLREAVDESVKGEIVGTLRSKADQVPEFVYLKWAFAWPPIAETTRASEASWTLHTREAFLACVDGMAAQGITALETAMASPATMPEGTDLDAGVSLPGGVADSPDAGVPTPDAGAPSSDPMDAGVR